jgi:hypothetical protein
MIRVLDFIETPLEKGRMGTECPSRTQDVANVIRRGCEKRV